MYVKALVSYIHWFEKFDLYRYRRKICDASSNGGRDGDLAVFQEWKVLCIVTIIINCFSKVFHTTIGAQCALQITVK